MKPDFIILSILLAMLLPLAIFVLMVKTERRRRSKQVKPPQEAKLLRPPGCSLAIRLDDLPYAILNDLLLACFFCAVAGGFAIRVSLFAGRRAMGSGLIGSGILCIGFAFAVASAISRAWRRFQEMQNIRLGLRGEQAVAESLHETADCGFRIFHDLPGGEDWNIDHIAAGTRGVFLIETKARSRRASRDGQPEHVMNYDGKVLRFPSGDDTGAVPQAERNTRWLAEFLGRKTAEPVTVEPIIVVPGWYVESRGSFPVKAMNASYLTGYLRNQAERIDPAQVRRIIAALDDKCRDVSF